MKPLLRDLPNFEEIFANRIVDDCTVRSKDIFYFTTYVTKWSQTDVELEDSDFEKQLICYFRDEPDDEKLSIAIAFEDRDKFTCEMTYIPLEQCVCFYGWDGCFSIGSGQFDEENHIDTQAMVSARCIGDRIYIAQSRRDVRYRTGVGEWQKLGDNETHPSLHAPIYDEDGEVLDEVMHYGFRDVDGFDQNTIYAVGGDGDVWRCVNEQWTECDFPSNINLYTVCCGEDGVVYISGYEGIVFAGKEDSWEVIAEPELSLTFDDMVWYEDRVWCTNDYGLWWIKDGKFEVADVPAEVKTCSGNLSTQDGVLLVAGLGGAAVLENGEWTRLFNRVFLP